MTKKEKVDLITAITLILASCVVMVLPIFKFTNVKIIFAIILGIYTIMNLVQFSLTVKSRDFEGLFTAIISIASSVLLFILGTKSAFNIALVLLIWVALMSLAKLKKADYYHDRKNSMWIIRVVMLALFIVIGILTSINLYYEQTTQVLLIGSFYFIHGTLELIDPLVNYLMEK